MYNMRNATLLYPTLLVPHERPVWSPLRLLEDFVEHGARLAESTRVVAEPLAAIQVHLHMHGQARATFEFEVQAYEFALHLSTGPTQGSK